MMYPRISIITPSFNQGIFIEETIKSVLGQNYPRFEHIIIDGGSTDGTQEILKRYPHLTVLFEPDKGQGDAVNKGLRMAKGEIIGWLNSDDTYCPGALKQAAEIIDPDKGISIVMGRCAYTDEDGRRTGLEHPSEFESHARVVKIWKGYTIPQPAVFFHREVYEKCGGLDETLHFAMDYELFLRYTRQYKIHPVNEIWATYRLHANSKTNAISEGELLEKSIEISRRYWGNSYDIAYWKYLFSYILYGGGLGVTSLKRLNAARNHLNANNTMACVANVFLSFILFPPTIFRHTIFPGLRSAISSKKIGCSE